MSPSHFHWIIWAYRGRMDNGEYQDNTSIEVIAETARDAMEKAEKLLPISHKGGAKGGAGYRIHSCIEHLDSQQCH